MTLNIAYDLFVRSNLLLYNNTLFRMLKTTMKPMWLAQGRVLEMKT